MNRDLRNAATALCERIIQLKDSLDYDSRARRAAEIDSFMAGTGFWENPEQAQAQVAELRQINAFLKPLQGLIRGGEDLQTLVELSEEDDSGSVEAEVRALVPDLEGKLHAAELQAAMAAPEDAGNAYVSIQAGEGGAESADFAGMLLRMYLRWANDRGFDAEVMDQSDAEEAGIRNATLHIRGDYAFGQLKGETGNHRLIRISPFDSAGRRHTSFAAVDVTPDLGDDAPIEIEWGADVREDVFRASGAGGQHVNKTSSAIRLTHLPTNVVVQCQNERSQHQNRAAARKLLIAKLYQMQQEKKEADLAARRGAKCKIGFGGQTIRNYVLQPEQFVKDTRSDLKATNPHEVLDGALDPLIEAYLRWSLVQ
ncbi:MAG: peptide chain release factor 2 [Planctomyces sp.]|nr:peptide chain release factor 2 [Planctomyces sp.]